MRPRRSFDLLGAWLLVVMGAVLLVAGAATLVDALVHGDWVPALVTAALLTLVAFGTLRGLDQLRHGRPRRHPDHEHHPDDH